MLCTESLPGRGPQGGSSFEISWEKATGSPSGKASQPEAGAHALDLYGEMPGSGPATPGAAEIEGYNQSSLLAEVIGKELHLPVLEALVGFVIQGARLVLIKSREEIICAEHLNVPGRWSRKPCSAC